MLPQSPLSTHFRKYRSSAVAKELITGYRTAFPDLHLTIADLIAEADKVVSRFGGTGTHSGDLIGIAPTGKQAAITGIVISRFQGGKVVEDWENLDELGMMQQLGAFPAGE